MAILLFDATIVRSLLVPAVVTLLGERNWYLPRRLDRVLSHEPGDFRATERGRVEPIERGAATGLCLAPAPVIPSASRA